MLRPATPLTILLFASFVLLLISTISTPIVKGIPIAKNDGVNYGVFGWCCTDSGQCSGITVGWNTDNIPCASNDANSSGNFDLSGTARNSLSSLLIVHPIAAFCNLVVLGLAIAAHFHSPSHSARYLLGLLILLLPTLLVTLLAFLVDILLFVPHLQWGGWIVLGSTILVTASGIVTCAMRRTLVSRKARKKRIAENAEMSGANFYARQAEESSVVPSSSHESKLPMVNGAPGADVLPTFATYDSRRSGERGPTIPPIPETSSARTPVEDGRFYGGPRSRSNSRPRPEDFSAPLGADAMADRPPMPSNRGSYGAPRGRGGYPSRGNISRDPSRGPPPGPYGPGRGGYPTRGRGGPPAGVVIPAGMNRRPPPGYGPQGPNEMDRPYMPPPQQGPYEPTSPSNYGPDPGPLYGPAYGSRAQSPTASRRSPYGSRAQSPSGALPPQDMIPPVPSLQPQYGAPVHDAVTRDMDPDVVGMVDMQRGHPQMNQQRSPPPQNYVPPRAGWNQTPHQAGPSSPRRRRINSGGSDYVEDVDPRFAEPAQPTAPPPQAFSQPSSQTLPSMLMPGPHPGPSTNPNDPSPESSSSQIERMPHTASFENLHPGARSPVESEASNFTSISQRPMNPNYQPGHGDNFNQFAPGPGPDRRQQQRRQDVLFSGNPDFELPGMGPPRSRPGNFRGRGGYGMGGPARPMNRGPPPPMIDNIGADGRYPASVPSQTGGSVREM